MWDDFFNKYILAVFKAKDEEAKAQATKELGEAHIKFMEDFSTKCLGDTKFLCGDEVSIADFACAGFYTNAVENPNNPWKDMWAA